MMKTQAPSLLECAGITQASACASCACARGHLASSLTGYLALHPHPAPAALASARRPAAAALVAAPHPAAAALAAPAHPAAAALAAAAAAHP